ncbi:MAG: 7-cyano-7-deazaguanine synthase QueC [Gemmatimonadota bacterium]
MPRSSPSSRAIQTAVVLVSGGLDSCVAAALARRDAGSLAFLHVNYRQRTQARELEAFHQVAAHFGVERRLVVDIDYLRQIGGSSLTDPALPVPDAREAGGGVPSTYVPFRNANLLAIGVAWAETLGADAVYLGIHAEGSLYPDCRPGFVDAFNAMVEAGTRPGTAIRVCAPLIAMDKEQVVRRGLELDAPLGLTWSCYQREDRPCGSCHSCQLRRRGFAAAGIADPALASLRTCSGAEKP